MGALACSSRTGVEPLQRAYCAARKPNRFERLVTSWSHLQIEGELLSA